LVRALHEPPHAHRKTGSFTYIPEVLQQLGMLEPGRRGLGFGVGREKLVSLFAARGVEVVATDLEPTRARRSAGPAPTSSPTTVDSMLHPELCDAQRFRELVSWARRHARDPDDLRGFDFCWSACSLSTSHA